MQRLLKILLTIAALCAFGSVAASAQDGVVQGVKPDAAAEGITQVRVLAVGSDVVIGETVTTGASGLVELLFSDQTKLVVGPNSKLKLEDYLVRKDGSAGKFAIAALAGTFRFITGNSPKDDYVIRTPTGTIGVRGTSFDLAVTEETPDFVPPADITAALLLFDGALDLCNLAGDCVLLDEICGFGAFNDAASVTVGNNREARALLRELFPLATNQGQLLRQFWVDNARQCIAPAPAATGGGTPSNLTGGTPGTVASPS